MYRILFTFLAALSFSVNVSAQACLPDNFNLLVTPTTVVVNQPVTFSVSPVAVNTTYTWDINGVVQAVAPGFTHTFGYGSYTVWVRAIKSGCVNPRGKATTFTLTKRIGNVAFDALNFTYDGNAKTISAHIAEEPATSCTVPQSPIGPNAGDYSVTATCEGTDYTASGSDTASIAKANQSALSTVADPASVIFGGISDLSTLGGSGSGAVSFAVTAGAAFCDITGTTLTGIGVGTCTVTATKAADANFNSATATVDVTILQAPQATLTAFAAPAAIAYDGTSTLSTSGGSGSGSVTFAVTSGVDFCSVVGSTLTGTGVGVCTVTATKAEDANYIAGTAMVNVEVLAAADLEISNDDGTLYALPDGFVEYQLLVGNAGPLAVQDARVENPVPAGLANAIWTCTAVQGATCPSPSGTGNIDQLVDLPVNAELRYVLSSSVTASLGDTIINTATVTVPNGTLETDSSDNTSSDVNTVVADGLFANGFETSSPLLRVQISEK